MAQGDLTLFNSFIEELGESVHDLENDVFKFALVSNTTVPAATTTGPHFGGTGTTNFATNEVSGTGYTAGGETISANALTLVSNVATWDDDDTNISWTQNGAGPTNIRWGIIYNSTDTNKRCVAFVEMTTGSDISLQAGNISYSFHASGILTITRS